MSAFDMSSYVEGISANLLTGGIIKSNDGKLTINLTTGHIIYNDGITTTTIA